MENELSGALINAGVGGAIAAMVIFLVYRLASGLAMNFGMKMVSAFETQAEAISRQALSMEGLSSSIKDSVARDDSEHREMLVLLKFIAQGQREIEELKKEHYECSKRIHGGVRG